MRRVEKKFTLPQQLVVAVWLVPFLAGCGETPEVPVAQSSAAASNAVDPDVYRPATPTPPPPPPSSAKAVSSQKQTETFDPDAYVAEQNTGQPKPRPANIAQTNSQARQQARQVVKQRPPNRSTPAPASQGENAAFDPDVYVPEGTQSTPANRQNSIVDVLSQKKSVPGANNRVGAEPMNLEDQLRLYQSNATDAATRLALEKEFVSLIRESLRALLSFKGPSPHGLSAKSQEFEKVAAQLWNTPFIDLLDIEQQTLTTLSERPGSVVLASLIPNGVVRADLRRTLARHWPEGPKVIRPSAAGDYPIAEPGFIAVLKSLIRENARSSSSKSPSTGFTRANSKTARNPRESASAATSSAEKDWNAFLEDLLRDYGRRCHKASLDRDADIYRAGGVPLQEGFQNRSSIPALPGCEPIAAHHFEWPGEHVSPRSFPSKADSTLDYQRFEKRMKASTPLLYYRRQLKSCIEHSLPNGVWLDGFVELKGEPRMQSVDVVITWPKAEAAKSLSEEQELTVEILCIEARKAIE